MRQKMTAGRKEYEEGHRTGIIPGNKPELPEFPLAAGFIVKENLPLKD